MICSVLVFDRVEAVFDDAPAMNDPSMLFRVLNTLIIVSLCEVSHTELKNLSAQRDPLRLMRARHCVRQHLRTPMRVLP